MRRWQIASCSGSRKRRTLGRTPSESRRKRAERHFSSAAHHPVHSPSRRRRLSRSSLQKPGQKIFSSSPGLNRLSMPSITLIKLSHSLRSAQAIRSQSVVPEPCGLYDMIPVDNAERSSLCAGATNGYKPFDFPLGSVKITPFRSRSSMCFCKISRCNPS